MNKLSVNLFVYIQSDSLIKERILPLIQAKNFFKMEEKNKSARSKNKENK